MRGGAQPRHLHDGRPARPAGAAQARLDGSRLAAHRRAAARRWWGSSAATTRTTSACCATWSSSCSARSSRSTGSWPRPGRSSCRPRRSITRSCRSCATPTSTCAPIRTRRCRAELFSRPEDAMRPDSARASRFTRRRSGRRRTGMWPSEGSVSDEALRLLADAGRRVDGDRRGDSGAHAAARRHRGRSSCTARTTSARTAQTVRCLFRDHALSDAIGFVYQSWDAEAAADDFVAPRA